jgi:tetratricopeptide (TPR) repeat protein
VDALHPRQRVSVAGELFQGARAPHGAPGDGHGGGQPGGEGAAYANLGCAYRSHEDYSKAIEYHWQHLAIAKEVGDRLGEGMAYGNLGNAYQALGDYAKAIEYHTQDLAIAKEVGDRAGEGQVYGNLGNAYDSLGDYAKAIEYHTQDLAIAREVIRPWRSASSACAKSSRPRQTAPGRNGTL